MKLSKKAATRAYLNVVKSRWVRSWAVRPVEIVFAVKVHSFGGHRYLLGLPSVPCKVMVVCRPRKDIRERFFFPVTVPDPSRESYGSVSLLTFAYV